MLLAATAAAFGLLAGACGGGSSDNNSGGTTTPSGSVAPDTAATGGSEAPTSEAGSTTVPAAQATPGGKVIMGIEADTSSPWMPAEMVCALSCHQIIKAIYDPMLIPNQDGGWSPYLLESLTPNADYTVWTMKARPNITFHDGTPLDGAALADNVTRFQKGILTGAYFSNVESATVNPADPLAVDVKMKTPWVTFPEVLLIGQIDYIASPTWMAAADKDETLKSKPVGTGPFVYEDYKPNEFFKAKKNPSYWNKPYPYLDEIEFRPIPDALNRRDALKSGAVDIIHTDNGQVITEFRDNKDFPQEEISNNAEVGYTLLHVTQVLPDGTKSPLQDQRVRCALANAWDQPTISQTIEQGVFPIADGPFAPGTPGYLKDNGFPQKQDMEKAKALIADYKKENPGPLNLSLATTQDETNLTIAQFQKQWWEEAGVDNVTLDQIDQGELHRHRTARELPGLPVAQPQRLRPRQPVHLVALLLGRTGRAAGPELRPDQGSADRRPPRQEPGRDGSGEEAGVRGGGQQDLRRPVLQPLGQLGHLGHRPQAHRPRRGELHPPRRQDQPVRPGHRRHLLPDDPVGRSVIGRHA